MLIYKCIYLITLERARNSSSNALKLLWYAEENFIFTKFRIVWHKDVISEN